MSTAPLNSQPRLVRPRGCAQRFGLLSVASISLLLLALPGCSSDAGEDGSGGTAGGSSTYKCSHATDTYTVGLAKDSTKGMFRVELMDADPAPPQKKANVWMLHVMDAQGQDVSGAQLSVTPTMPDHGHGSTEQTSVTDLGDGMYELSPVFLQMAGYWAVKISITKDAETDTAQYDFCVAP